MIVIFQQDKAVTTDAEKPKLYSEVTKEPKVEQVNGLPEKEVQSQVFIPQDNSVPTHQYSSTSQVSQPADHRPELVEIPQSIPPVSAPTSNVNNVPIPQTLPAFQNINPNLLNPSLQANINLTTPLQIATDSPLLGLSQVGTPMGGDLGLNVGLGQMGQVDPMGLTRLQTMTPTQVNDTLPNAENLQRMLLKQNIMK